MRIFLSYGHDDYASLAFRIKRDLEALGHEVWSDVERLKPGGDWERYIEEGFEFASKDHESGRFLLLMTPHSVRRPDGYCLNELARAYGRGLPIIPVMVSDVEPPLSIARLQWFDMRQCFPVDEFEEKYAKKLDQLVEALIEKQVPFEGVQQRLLNYLQPMTYGDDVTRHLSRFKGRKWVMQEFEEWLASSRRVLWITGEPGVGKSAMAAWLCNKRPEIAAYHFCRYGNSDRVDARKALFSLSYQLSTQLPVYRDRLNASPLEKTFIETNLAVVFDRLFVNLLTDAVPLTNKPHVLLIDALDEATREGKNELSSLIGRESNRLPAWLRVIVTSRPYEQEINFALQALDPWKIDAGRSENLNDIREYLEIELQPFMGKGAPSEQMINAVVEKSEGLFLYVSWVRQELQEGRLSLGEIEKFPRGLGGIYVDSFQRYFPDLREYGAVCRPALEAICAAREPLDRRDLASLLERSEYDMRQLSARLGSLFPAVDGRVRPFHRSVRDWLTDPDRSGDYWIDISVQEHRLADLAWREYKDGVHTMGRYCITHGPSHLASCGRKTELIELLLDPDWIVAKIQTAGIVPSLADYDLAVNILSPQLRREVGRKLLAQARVADDRETSALRLVQGAIRLSSNVIAEDFAQFAPQMVGRLLPYRDLSAIKQFTDRVVEGAPAPWLRPVTSALHPPGTPLLRTLEGHSGAVCGVALTRDGRLAVSGSGDHTLKVWDLDSGRALCTLEGHSGPVNGVALTPDERQAVSASADHTLKVWDLATGRVLCTLEGHSNAVHVVAVTPDGKRAVSGSHDKTLKVWDLETGSLLRTLEGHTNFVYGVAVTPDSKRVVSASRDTTLKVWDLDSGRALLTLEGHSNWWVYGVAVTADGKHAVSASKDATLKVWNLDTGLALRSLQDHVGYVWSVAVTADSKRAISASADRTVKVWDLETGSLLQTLEGHSDFVYAVAVTPDGTRAVSASLDHTLRVWDLRIDHDPRLPEGHPASVFGVAVTADGKRAVSACWDKTLKVWDLDTGLALCTLKGHSAAVNSVAVTADGERAVSVSSDRTLKVWDLDTGRLLRTLEGHTNFVNIVAVTADGKWAASGSKDKTLKVWDLDTGHVLRTLEGHSGPVYGVAMTADGKRAVSASEDCTLKVWDLDTGRALHTLAGHSKSVCAVAMTADGKQAVSASEDCTLKVWDLDTGRVLHTLEGHSSSVDGVAVTTDGKQAVSASRDKMLKVWDLSSGQVIAGFTCDAAATCCAFINADEIIAGDGVGRVFILKLEMK